MRRLPILLAFALVFALFVVAAASAGPSCIKNPNHQDCTTTMPPTTLPTTPPTPLPVEDCFFDGDGVLVDSVGGQIDLDATDSGIRCRFTANPDDSFDCEISGDARVVHIPYIAVTDVYPHSGNLCFREYAGGRVLPGTGEPDGLEEGVFALFEMSRLDTYDEYGTLTDGICGLRDDTDGSKTYALSFSIGNAKGGAVHLTVTPRPQG
jgi:hypothetical protein